MSRAFFLVGAVGPSKGALISRSSHNSGAVIGAVIPAIHNLCIDEPSD